MPFYNYQITRDPERSPECSPSERCHGCDECRECGNCICEEESLTETLDTLPESCEQSVATQEEPIMNNELSRKILNDITQQTQVDFFTCPGGTVFPPQFKALTEELFTWAVSKTRIKDEMALREVILAIYKALDMHRSRSTQGDTYNSICPKEMDAKILMLTTHRDSIDFIIQYYRSITGNSKPSINTGLFEYSELLYACAATHLMNVLKSALSSIPKYKEW